MLFLSFLRIIKFSLQDVGRNIWLSIVTITILILALFSINMLLVVKVISQTAIDAIKDKVDVSLYLVPEAEENEILALKAEISNLNQVKEVTFISKAEALEFFRKKNEDNPEILQALRELGKNPLTPSLVIKPKNTESVDQFITELNKIESGIIESRNFTDHKLLLGKINNITDKVNRVGFAVSLIFILTTLLVVYNAIRVAIYTHRREINIMKLVGASNPFVYMPFLFSSIIYTFIGVAVATVIFYPFLGLLQPYLEAFFIDYNINLVSYFNENFINIFGLQFAGIALINIFASFIAVRKYAKV
ncbi:MAG: permease-like cell division protein FtsX [Patescibacteria group bacterium]